MDCDRKGTLILYVTIILFVFNFMAQAALLSPNLARMMNQSLRLEYEMIKK